MKAAARRRLSRWREAIRPRTLIAKGIAGILSHSSDRARARVVESLLRQPVEVSCNGRTLRYLNHGVKANQRAEWILEKEPDTLRWIDRMAPGSIFWDLGANIGAYSVYAATRGDIDVIAVEPAAVNFYNLCANLELNRVSERVKPFLFGASNSVEIRPLMVSQFESALSFRFGENENVENEAIQYTPTMSVDQMIRVLSLPVPTYMKIDVPLLTVQILEGAKETLSNSDLKEIQIEMSADSKGGRVAMRLLEEAGFRIVHRNTNRKGRLSGDLIFGRES